MNRMKSETSFEMSSEYAITIKQLCHIKAKQIYAHVGGYNVYLMIHIPYQ